MPRDHGNALLRHIHRLAGVPSAKDLSDGELLQRFVTCGEETAFAVLLKRHGPMVWGVCRRILSQEQDLEDAFQATFLVLTRRACSIRKGASLASWLHGVAYRVAVRIQQQARKRRQCERQAESMSQPSVVPEAIWRELQALLDEELSRLPEKYRAPFVLCCLEGKSRTEAAQELGWKEGTVSSRLAQAREKLRQRLARRGVTLTAPLAGAALTEGVVPAALKEATVQAVVQLAAGQPLTVGLVSAQAVAIAQGMAKGKLFAALFLLAGFVAAGGGLLGRQAFEEPPAEVKQQTTPKLVQPTPQGQAEVLRDRLGDPLPPGAIARMGTLRLRHSGFVMSVCFSPDGRTLASGSEDHSIRLWDKATGKELRRFTGHTGYVMGLAFSKDGKALASVGGDGMVYVWDLTTDKQRLLFKAYDGSAVACVAISPDGKSLATGGVGMGHRTLVLWDLATGKELYILGDNGQGVDAVAFSPDGKLLASGSNNLTWFGRPHGQRPPAAGSVVQLWDVATGKEVRTLQREAGGVSGVAFSSDGKTLASASHDGTARLWDVGTGEQLLCVRLREDQLPPWTGPRGSTNTGGFHSVALSPDGKTLATGTYRGTILLWDTRAGREIQALQEHWREITSLAFSPDGKILASGSYDNTIRLWDPATGKELRTSQGHTVYSSTVVVSPNGKQIASAGGGNTLLVWELETGKELAVFRGHSAGVSSIVFSPDGRMLASAEFGESVRLWDAATGKEVWKRNEPKCYVMSVSLSRDGKLLATASLDGENGRRGTVRLLDPATGNDAMKFKDELHGSYWAANFTPDGKTLVVEETNSIILLDVPSGREIRRYSISGRTALSSDGQTAIARSEQGTADVHDVATGRLLYSFGVDPNQSNTRPVISPDGKTLAWASTDQKVRLWEIATGKVRRELTGHEGEVLAVAYAPDGRTLVSASRDTTLLVWDTLRWEDTRRVNLSTTDLRQLWDDLSDADAARSFRAIGSLVAAPRQAVPLLEEHLRPVKAPAPEQLTRWVANLDHEDFSEREKTTQALEKLDTLAAPALRKALESQPGLEARRRIEALLRKLDGPVTAPELLRGLRSVEVLEHIGTPEARRVLQALADGAAGARLTEDAKAALARLPARDARR